MKRFRRFLQWLMVASVTLSALASEAEPQKVLWARTDFAPFFILKGPYQDQGVGDQLIHFFANTIEGYRHEPTQMSIKRVLQLLQDGVPLCHVAFLKTPSRDAFVEYSDPLMWLYANGVVTTKAMAEKLGHGEDNPPSVSLEQLRRRGLRLSVHDGRAYSPVIDAEIQREAQSDPSLFRVKTGLKETPRLLRMIELGQVDGIILRPEELNYEQMIGETRQPLQFLPLKNTQLFSPTHVACTRGHWNDSLLNQVNERIRSGQAVAIFTEAYSRWLPLALRDRFLQAVNSGELYPMSDTPGTKRASRRSEEHLEPPQADTD
ncbi:hypothetical protein QQM79_09490 [Marinobacteraceae bacterium S3BR75-40.1]